MGESDATTLHLQKEIEPAQKLGPKSSHKVIVFDAQSRGSIGSLSNAKTPNTHS
jgi:hypothetical protein